MATSRPRCNSTRTNGEPCHSFAVTPDGRCAAHNSSLPFGGREQARQAGIASGHKRRKRAQERNKGIQERLAEHAEERAEEILAAYDAGLRSDDARVRVQSAEALLTRVFGRPTERIETEHKAPLGRLTNLTETELRKLRAELEESNVIPLPRLAGDPEDH